MIYDSPKHKQNYKLRMQVVTHVQHPSSPVHRELELIHYVLFQLPSIRNMPQSFYFSLFSNVFSRFLAKDSPNFLIVIVVYLLISLGFENSKHLWYSFKVQIMIGNIRANGFLIILWNWGKKVSGIRTDKRVKLTDWYQAEVFRE